MIDLLRTSGANIKQVYLTGTNQVVKGQWGVLHLGKSLMVSRLQVLLQMERIHLPNVEEAALLADDLLNYEIRVNDNANAQFGAFRVGSHDDLPLGRVLHGAAGLQTRRRRLVSAVPA